MRRITGSVIRTALRRNLAANFAAQIWTVVLSLAFVPVFLHLLGAEGYGLVGLAVSLQAVLAVLDLGLATTANREFSRTGGRGTDTATGPIMLRSLEVIYFGMGLLIAGGLVLAAPWISEHWIRSGDTPSATVRTSLALFGVATGLRWPVGLYSGVLSGLERQVPLNAVVMARSALRTAGAALVLILVSRTVEAYFAWLVVVSCLEVIATAWLAWRSQPAGSLAAARFDPAGLRSYWAFSGELTLVSLFAAVLKQLDKVVIARFAPLAALGHYSVASTLSSGLLLCATPVFAAVFPRFTATLARGEAGDTASIYHRAARLVAMLVSPAAAVLMLFPGPVLSAWTRSPAATAGASGALAVLAVAMLLNACMQVPYALLLAAGYTRISLWINGLGVLVVVPLMVVLVREYGIVGGGVAWAVFNLAYFLLAPAILHRRVLRGHLGQWLWSDTLPFLALAAGCYGAAAWLGRGTTGWRTYALIGAASVCYAGVVVVTRRGDAAGFFAFTGPGPARPVRSSRGAAEPAAAEQARAYPGPGTH
jgi:O-antigen/teichoic acid export membrane protein